MFPTPFKVKIKDGKIKLYIKLNDEVLVVRVCSLSEMDELVAEYQAQRRKHYVDLTERPIVK